jgi:hypothetical protein
MSQIDFILDAEEERELLDTVFSAGASMIPDLHFEEPSLTTISDFEGYCSYRERTSLFFILHDSYNVCPIEIRAGQKQGVPFFFVMQRNGGPAIHYVSTYRFMKDGKLTVNPGFLSHYPTFWNTTRGQNQKPPAALLSLFRTLFSNIRGMSKSIKYGKRTYRVGRKTIEGVKEGKIEIGFPLSL